MTTTTTRTGPGGRRILTAALTAALTLSGVGILGVGGAAAATAVPSSDGTTLTWTCDDPLEMNHAWVLGSSSYWISATPSTAGRGGSLPLAAPFALAVGDLPTGTYEMSYDCHYVPGWDPEGGSHTTHHRATFEHVSTAVDPEPAPAPVLTVMVPLHVPADTPFPVSASITGERDVPEGDVQFIAHRPDGLFASLNTTLVGGQVSATFPGLPAGQWFFLAHYSGSSEQGIYPQADSPEVPIQAVAPVVPVPPTTPPVPTEPTPVPAPVPVQPEVPASVTTPVASPGTLVVGLPDGPRPSTLRVLRGDTVLATVAVPPSGPVTVPLPVLEPGTHELVLVTDATPELLESRSPVTVTVAGVPSRTEASPSGVLAAPTTVAPGDAVPLTADGFEAGETIAFHLYPGEKFLGTAVADADGHAVLTMTAPEPSGTSSASATLGADAVSAFAEELTVIATGGSSGRWARSVVTLAAPAAPAPPTAPTTPPAPTVPAPADPPTAPAPSTPPTAPVPSTPVAAPVPVPAPAPGAAPVATTDRSELARTGSEVAPFVLLQGALLLVAAGALLARRRRTAA
ncbi:hypothetical protein [Sanguibacter suaedae]|uniref:LPXTG cell wall anchor domain-containing protein n=1 Tax=Sanguibacter suaedae TaxID=2795737 RepID=A0A934IDQ1_9MICO|nr:hypothetical protein [Sanguibacter suaedae]MBI9115956.1 hypothetical protein [Sanguibacter suaedae]